MTQSHKLPRRPISPTGDEWGIYDPEQTGLPAVFRRVIARLRAANAAAGAPPRPKVRMLRVVTRDSTTRD